MWVILAFCSALLLGLYDVAKKQALHNNAVIPVLFANTAISLVIYIPFILLTTTGNIGETSMFYAPVGQWHEHRFVILKSFIVLSSWLTGYFGLKHLPITIVGPINATRPVMVLLGAMILFGERLNLWQWSGVLLAVISIFLLNKAGKKEGIDFRKDKWIFLVALSAMLGAVSGLYDKFLMGRYAPLFVQSWFNIYQFFIMSAVTFTLWWPSRNSTTPFKWRNAIILIPVILAIADFAYFWALSYEDSMISIVSMIRRGSVVVSFTVGALIFREKNIRSKAIDLLLILLGMVMLYIGSR